MIQQSLFDRALEDSCPKCGSTEFLSLDELARLINDGRIHCPPDLSHWLRPPKAPGRPVSGRRRVAVRNSMAFGIALVAALTVAVFAVTGSLPAPGSALPILLMGTLLGFQTWRTESKLAAEEETLQLDTYWELYRAYLNRQQVWARLRYCSNCSIVIDPATLQTRSLFEVHELANRRTTGASLR